MSDFGKGINVPSKDIVYRQDVEDMLQNALPSRGMWEIEGDVVKNTICETVGDLMMDLEKLPSADVQPAVRWIPCSERLPHTNGVYNVTRKISDGFEYRNISDSCYYDGAYTWHDDTRVNHERRYLTDVIAWMPLPKPYQEDEQDE